MNIYAIGRNFDEHIHELGNARPSEPVVFLKPASSVVFCDDTPLKLPVFMDGMEHETELVICLDCTKGARVAKIGVGLDFTLRQKQSELKAKALPWLLAKGFKNSGVIGTMVDFNPSLCYQFSLGVNDTLRQLGCIDEMLFNIDEILTFLAQYFTLCTGDLVFLGTPKGVGSVHAGDTLMLTLTDGSAMIQNQVDLV